MVGMHGVLSRRLGCQKKDGDVVCFFGDKLEIDNRLEWHSCLHCDDTFAYWLRFRNDLPSTLL